VLAIIIIYYLEHPKKYQIKQNLVMSQPIIGLPQYLNYSAKSISFISSYKIVWKKYIENND